MTENIFERSTGNALSKEVISNKFNDHEFFQELTATLTEALKGTSEDIQKKVIICLLDSLSLSIFENIKSILDGRGELSAGFFLKVIILKSEKAKIETIDEKLSSEKDSLWKSVESQFCKEILDDLIEPMKVIVDKVKAQENPHDGLITKISPNEQGKGLKK